MKITFVNHASFLLESQGVRLLADPWLEGTAFHDGWGLLAPSAFQYEDFARVTHLWFSHEHPDHFSPPCLKKIPEQHRRHITVLFQETRDGKVIEFCRKLGFGDVRELAPGRHVPLADGVEVLVEPCGGFADSWMHVRTPEGTLLNLNDCTVNRREQAAAIRERVGPVDVLFTQFSISAWDGNAEDLERRQAGARTMLERCVMQTEVMGARCVVPFASFIWFCHAENAYMNQAFLPIGEVETTLRRRTRAQPVVLYPGDEWSVSEAHDSSAALRRYGELQEALSSRPALRARSVPAEDLIAASHEFRAQVAAGSDASKLRLHLARRSRTHRRRTSNGVGPRLRSLAGLIGLHVEPARIFVHDHERAYLFDLYQGLRPVDLPRSECEVVVGSEALNYAFRFLWGGESLLINGRFSELWPGSRRQLFEYFGLAGQKNSGKTVRWSTLPATLARRALGALGWSEAGWI